MSRVVSIPSRHPPAPRFASQPLPPATSPLYRLNVVCPYYTMFPLAFPLRILQRASAGDWVLDPFCGRGTAVFAARLLGLSCAGLDSNPVAAAIAGVKLCQVSGEQIADLAKEIIAAPNEKSVPSDEFWGLCFHDDTLAEICKLRERLLRKCTTQVEVALRAVVLGILHGPINKGVPTYLSNQMPRTYATKPRSAVNFWRKHRMQPKRVDVFEAICRRAGFTFSMLPAPVPGRVLQADSRSFTLPVRQRTFRWIITSPPYYGMRSYFPDQWLRNWFVGGPETVSYSTEQQVPHSSEADFTSGLAAVWQRSAAVCLPGAKLIVRFGALPSASKDPTGLLTHSLREANCGWRITTLRHAGTAQKGRRQYEQFGATKSDPIEEIDLYARLED